MRIDFCPLRSRLRPAWTFRLAPSRAIGAFFAHPAQLAHRAIQIPIRRGLVAKQQRGGLQRSKRGYVDPCACEQLGPYPDFVPELASAAHSQLGADGRVAVGLIVAILP